MKFDPKKTLDENPQTPFCPLLVIVWRMKMLATQTLATKKSMTIEKNDDRNFGDRKTCGNKRIWGDQKRWRLKLW